MLSAILTGMHRHTRPAAYADRSQQRRTAQAARRPGAYGFSFTGEFEEAPSYVPVEAAARRRRYSEPSGKTGSYRAVGSDGTMRIPAINRYGVRIGPALAMLTMLAVLLAGVILWQNAENTRMSKLIDAQNARIISLGSEANETLSDITLRSSGVNIRQEATRIGLMSSRGVPVKYLNVPPEAVYGPGAFVGTQELASVWGQ